MNKIAFCCRFLCVTYCYQRMGSGQQLRLLLWKDFLVRKRQPVSFFFIARKSLLTDPSFTFFCRQQKYPDFIEFHRRSSGSNDGFYSVRNKFCCINKSSYYYNRLTVNFSLLVFTITQKKHYNFQLFLFCNILHKKLILLQLLF